MELFVECHVGLSRAGSWRRLTLMFPRSPDVERTHRHLRLVLGRGQNGEESVGEQRMAERGISTCGNSIIIVGGGGVTIIIFIWALLP